MIAVTGATGHLGRLVVHDLLGRGVPPSEIVAAVRSPDETADLFERGMDVREADYDQPHTLDAAFEDVDQLLLISSSEVGQRVPQHQNVVDAAAATVLTEDGHEDERYELGGDKATTGEPADVVAGLSVTEVVHRDLPVEDHQQALVDAGLPESQAEVFADADQGIAEGHFYTQSDDLRRPIGRPTTPLEEAVADALEART
jgi:uncharacterized protein YbjT (DUF2867 family)